MSCQGFQYAGHFWSPDTIGITFDVVDQCVILGDIHMVQTSSDYIIIDYLMTEGSRF